MDQLQYEKFLEVLSAMEENESDLTGFESDFLRSMQQKLKDYDKDARLSERQAEVLVKIAKRLEIDAEILL